MVTKVWKCKKCNIYFEPKLPSLKCPKCLGNTTVPAKEYEPNQHALWEPTSAEKVNCPQCNELMANGFLVETNSPFDLTTLGEGIYWTTSAREEALLLVKYIRAESKTWIPRCALS